MKTLTKEIQNSLSPKDALNILIEGNKRFIENKRAQRDLQNQVATTSQGQYPFAVILSCIDSRVPTELIFDLGIGDVFSVKVAGNVINEDVLGSMEYACKVAGSKIVVVLGHTKCGAVTAACSNVELGNITSLLTKIEPAVDSFRTGDEKIEGDTIESVSIENVKLSKQQILTDSPILNEMEVNGEIEIIGASYDVNTGLVSFFE
jgi:carbonic anhydrase